MLPPVNGPSIGAVQVGALPEKLIAPVPPYTKTWFMLTVLPVLVWNTVELSPRKYTNAALVLELSTVVVHGSEVLGVVQLVGREVVGLLVLMFNVPPCWMVTLSSKTTLPSKVTVEPLPTTNPLFPRVQFT